MTEPIDLESGLTRIQSELSGIRHAQYTPDQRRQALEGLLTERRALIANAAHSLIAVTSSHASAVRRLTRFQLIFTVSALILLCAGLIFQPLQTVFILNVVFVVYCLLLMIFRMFVLSRHMQVDKIVSRPRGLPTEFPVITILVPLYREAGMVRSLHKALQQLEYPANKLDIKILVEHDDPETITAARNFFTDPQFHIIVIPPSGPKTKPKALNVGLWLALGEYCVVYDAEDRPDPDQIAKAVQKFRASPSDVVCLQARLNYYNRDQNILTRLFALEYAFLFDMILPALSKLGAPLPLGGTSNFFNTRALRESGGWDPYNVTEDADIGLRLSARGYRCEILDSTTWEEATPGISGWIRQRSRWIKGYIQTWFVHTRCAAFKGNRWKQMLTLHLLVGGVIIAALINPFFWTLYALWMSGLTPSLKILFPQPLGAIALISFLGGNLLLIYMLIIAPLERRWYRYCFAALLFPLYWFGQSVAGFIALAQFIRRPFFWDKTTHHPQVQ